MDKPNIHVRPAKITDIPEIVLVCNSSILPREDIGFGGGIPGPFQDPAKLASIWKEPNIAQRSEIWVAEMRDRIVGVTRIENKGDELELIDIDVPLDLQGQGIGTQIVRSIEERARREGKRAVTLGTSRDAEGVAWKSYHGGNTWAIGSHTKRRTNGAVQSDQELPRYVCGKISTTVDRLPQG